MYKAEDYKMEIFYSNEDKCFIGVAPELEGCSTNGDTPAHCLEMLKEAIELWLESSEANNLPIPEPIAVKNYSGKLSLRIDPSLHREVAFKAGKANKSINKFIESKLKEAI